MKTIGIVIAFLGMWSVCSGVATAQSRPSTAPGVFFRTRQVDGVWWLVDPRGQLFLSKGVTTVQFHQDYIRGTQRSPYGETNQAKYGSERAWREAAAKRLLGWGFNSVGAWSDERLCAVEQDGRRLVCAPTIDLGAAYVSQKMKGRQAWLEGVFPDVFDPEFERVVREEARKRCVARKDDPSIMGWFTDNELHWGPDWRGKEELLTVFLGMPAESAGKKAAVEMLQRRYGEVGKFNEVWRTKFADWKELPSAGAIKAPFTGKVVLAQNQEAPAATGPADPNRSAFIADCEEFLGMLAERYFRLTTEAVRAADPNHMVFGARFAIVPPKPVIAAAAAHLDVISFNCYGKDPRAVIKAYATAGKPLIIGEFSFRAKDSGLPNTKGAGPIVNTQQERAEAFARYVTQAIGHPNVVGCHWFEHADEPKEGRFDGEDSNYGVVNIKDEPYGALVEQMTKINAEAEKLHRAAAGHP